MLLFLLVYRPIAIKIYKIVQTIGNNIPGGAKNGFLIES